MRNNVVAMTTLTFAMAAMLTISGAIMLFFAHALFGLAIVVLALLFYVLAWNLYKNPHNKC